MNKLEEICNKKRSHVEKQKKLLPLLDIEEKLQDIPLSSGFLATLKRTNGPAVIAEVKKASPSCGVIREDFDPVGIAQIYKDAGASCLSVLTDEPYFQGHDNYLVQIKKEVDIPVLRKDFIIDVYQIYESRVLGADCILLIAAVLSDKQLWEFYEVAREIGMDVLIEVHNLQELERALRIDPAMIGVNNRNLKTLDVDLQTSFELVMNIPANVYKISESGISTHDTIQRLNSIGYGGFLVGESLMRENDTGAALRLLLGKE